jgi:Trypsin-co-occurring domain 2
MPIARLGAGMIELAEVIGELRRELQAAMNDGEGEQLRFELGPVELEATVAVEKGGGGRAKVRFWVIELGGDAKAMAWAVIVERLTAAAALDPAADDPLRQRLHRLVAEILAGERWLDALGPLGKLDPPALAAVDRELHA